MNPSANPTADQLSNAPTVDLQDVAIQTPPSTPAPKTPSPSKKRKRRPFRFSISDYPGPVFFKELSLLSRRSSTYWTRGLFCLGLTFIIAMTFIGIYLEWSSNTTTAYRLQSLQVVSPAIMMALSIFMAVLLPLSAAALSGGAICDERRKGSLSTLMTTPITTLQIIIGKVAGASAQLLMLAILALPLLLSIRIFGGLPPRIVFAAFTIIITSTLMVASVTTWCSIYAKRPTSAMVTGLIVCACIYFLPLFLLFLSAVMLSRAGGLSPIFMIYSSPVALGITLSGMFDNTITGVRSVDDYAWFVASVVNIAITCFSIAGASFSLRRAIRKEQDGGGVGGSGQSPPLPAASVPSVPTPSPPTPPDRSALTPLLNTPESTQTLPPPNISLASDAPAKSSIKPTNSAANSHSGLAYWIVACLILIIAYVAQDVVHLANQSVFIFPGSVILCGGTYFVIRRLCRTAKSGPVLGNPVLWREWRQPAFKSQRSAFLAFSGLTAFVFVLALFGEIESSASVGIATLLTLSIMVVAAVTTTSALSSERESRTIESLLTTPLSAQEIVMGKLLGALRRQWFSPTLLIFLLLTVGVCTNTISFIALPILALVIFPPFFFLNATGVLLSILLPKSAQAAVLNIFVALFLWLGLPIIVQLTHEMISEFTDLFTNLGEFLFYSNPIFVAPNITLYFASDTYAGSAYRVPYLGNLDTLEITVFHLFIAALYALASFLVLMLAARILARRTLRKALPRVTE